MNYSLLRRVQASILDETKRFNMSDWGCCIAGHCRMIVDPDRGLSPWYSIGPLATDFLRLSRSQAEALFYDYADSEVQDRHAAAAKIERLIEQDREARREKAAQALVVRDEWLALLDKSAGGRVLRDAPLPSHPSEALPSAEDMAAIDRLIEEAQPELVGA